MGANYWCHEISHRLSECGSQSRLGSSIPQFCLLAAPMVSWQYLIISRYVLPTLSLIAMRLDFETGSWIMHVRPYWSQGVYICPCYWLLHWWRRCSCWFWGSRCQTNWPKFSCFCISSINALTTYFHQGIMLQWKFYLHHLSFSM